MAIRHNLRILPADAGHIEESRREVTEKTRQLVSDLLKLGLHRSGKTGTEATVSSRMANLVLDINNMRFWGTLAYVDGHAAHKVYWADEETRKRNAETRAWALESIDRYTLGQILDLAVNQALLHPVETSWPGTRHPYMLLYEDLFQKEDSIFDLAHEKDFIKRLHNGRLWEGLTELDPTVNQGYGRNHVADVLLNHRDSLDPGFAPQGLELMVFSEGGKRKPVEFRHLNEEVLDAFISYFASVDDCHVLSPGQAESLIKDYLDAMLSWQHNLDDSDPVYNGRKDEDGIMHGVVSDKLRVDVVQRYLDQKPVRDHVIGILSKSVRQHPNAYGQNSKFVSDVVSCMSDPQEAVSRILYGSDDVRQFVRQTKQGDHSLAAYLP